MQRISHWLWSTAILIGSVSSTLAQDSQSRVVPYFEKTTVAALNVSLSKLDFPSVIDWIGKISPNTPLEERNKVKAVGGSIITPLQQAGVSDAYVSVSLSDLWSGGFVVYLPCQDTGAVKALAEVTLKQLAMLAKFQVHAEEGIVVVARNDIWTRISSKPNGADKGLLQSIGPDPLHNIVLGVCVPDELRKEVAQMLPPNVPEGFPVKFSPQELMSDVRSIRLTINASAQSSLSGTVNADTAEGAHRSQTLMSQFLSLLPDVGFSSKIDDQSLKFTVDDQKLSDALQAYVASIRLNSMNNIRQMGLGIMEYEQVYKKLPPRETRSKDGKPLLSWRVHILPYLDEGALWKKFHLDEPWDSPHNASLIPLMPAIFALDDEDAKSGKTRFEMPMLEGGTWYGNGKQVEMAQMTDGAANTIALVQAPKKYAVTWTKPQELDLTLDTLTEKIFGDADSTNAMFFDGSVRKILRSTDPTILKAMITMAGNEKDQLP